MKLTVPKFEPYGDRYKLLNDVTCEYTHEGKERTLFIKAGFITDGASIPRVCWSIIGSPFLPQFIRAALVHDKHCIDIDKQRDGDTSTDWTVDEISDLFFDILKEDGVKGYKAWLMEKAVRVYKSIA